jgi:ethanolamine permease
LPHGWGGAFAALPFAIWFYLAIEGLANVAEEAKNPQRDLPVGFLLAMLTLVALTALTLFGAVGSAGWREVVFLPNGKTSDSPLPLAIGHVVSRDSVIFDLLTGIGLVGLVASFHGIIIAASRSLLEFGRAGYAPRALGQVHPGTRTPAVALVANLGVGMIALVTGKTEQIILIAVFGALTLYILSSAAVIALRRREPDLNRPYRAPLYPYSPIVAITLALVCMGAMVWTYPWIAFIYLVIVASSYVLFLLFVPADARVSFRS